MSDDLPTTTDACEENRPTATDQEQLANPSQTPPPQSRDHDSDQVIDAEFHEVPDTPANDDSTLALDDQDTFVAELMQRTSGPYLLVPYPILKQHGCVTPSRPAVRTPLGDIQLTLEHPRTYAHATIRGAVGDTVREPRVYLSESFVNYWQLSDGDRFKAHIEEFTPNPDTKTNSLLDTLF
jgi:hypothetical protein